jgi:hypothetical protein
MKTTVMGTVCSPVIQGKGYVKWQMRVEKTPGLMECLMEIRERHFVEFSQNDVITITGEHINLYLGKADADPATYPILVYTFSKHIQPGRKPNSGRRPRT